MRAMVGDTGDVVFERKKVYERSRDPFWNRVMEVDGFPIW